MTIPRLIPVLLVHEKKLQKSVKFTDWTYVGDVLNTVKIFNDKDVDEIVILNTDGNAPDSSSNLEMLTTIAQECFMPIAYGGGIRTIEEVRRVISTGIDKIIVNNAFLDNPRIIAEMAKVVGSSSVVVSLDVIIKDGDYRVFDNRLRVATSRELYEQIRLAEEYGAGEVLIQSVDRDGTRSEPDYELVEKLASVISVPLVYAGGVSSLDDAAKLWGLGVDGVAAGSWFIFRGRLRAVMVNYPDRNMINSHLEL